jgi:hypothetical protein
LLVSITEAPESLLKRFEVCAESEGLPSRPPIPSKKFTELRKIDLMIARNAQTSVRIIYAVWPLTRN